MPSSALVTQLFSSLMRVYRTFPPVAPKNFIKATILSNYAGAFEHGDTNGEKSLAAMTFHPLATQAILGLAYFPINHTRVGCLKRPLSRWLTSRMSHNYRQARKSGYVHSEGYHIALKTILQERGVPRKSRLRDNVDSVREALTEMKQRRILAEMQPYDENLTYASTNGRPKIVEADHPFSADPEEMDDLSQKAIKLVIEYCH